MRRGVVLGLALGGVVAAAAGGWLAGRQVQSPAEAAAEAAPPEPSRITVPVERITLSSDLVVRGDVVYDEPVSVSLSRAPAETPVVTIAPEEGATLEEGDIALEVIGRPVFALAGDIPMYRDLGPGAEGDDVAIVEAALGRLAFFAGAADGVYDEATETAIAAWYEAAGYDPTGPTDAEQDALDAAEAGVETAEDGLRQAQLVLAEAQEPKSASQELSLRAGLRAAQDQLALARLTADQTHARNAALVADAVAARDDAKRAKEFADERLRQAMAGMHPDTGLPPTPEELAILEQEAADAATARTLAQQALDAAVATQTQEAAEAAAAVRAAEDAVVLAQVSLEEFLAPTSVSLLSEAVVDAQEDVATANEQLAELQAEIGITLPASEVIILATLPVRIDDAAVERGSTVSGAVMTVTGSRLAIKSSLDAADAQLVAVDTVVRIEEDDLGVDVEGVVAFISDRPGTDGVAEDDYYMEVLPDETPEGLVGANVKITIPVGATAGEVLAVPAAALSATADGSTRVEVEEADGTTRFVTVMAGLAAQGLVEITALDGDLAEGDLVVVGSEARDDA